MSALTVSPGFDFASLLEGAPDPDPALAHADEGRLLAYLFVSPRPCEAVDRLMERGAWRVG